jgi:hypothetical protein
MLNDASKQRSSEHFYASGGGIARKSSDTRPALGDDQRPYRHVADSVRAGVCPVLEKDCIWALKRVELDCCLLVTFCSPSLMWNASRTLSPAAQLFSRKLMKKRDNFGEKRCLDSP